LEYHGQGFDADAKGGKTKADGGPSLSFRMSAKPRFTSATQALNGNRLSMWDFSGGDLYMQFSPDIQQNIRNGLAQIDLGSTDSSYTHSNIDQTYFQLDFTKHFGGVIPTVNFGAKYRSGQVHRETGNTYWYSDPTTQTRYQSGDPNASSTQPDFFSSAPLGRIPSGFHANLFPAINFPAYLNSLNSTYGPQRLQRRLGSSAHRLWRPPGVERDGGQQGVETLPGLAVRSGTRVVFPAGLGAGGGAVSQERIKFHCSADH